MMHFLSHCIGFFDENLTFFKKKFDFVVQIQNK